MGTQPEVETIKGRGTTVKNKGLLTTAVVALVVVIGYDYAKAKGMGKR